MLELNDALDDLLAGEMLSEPRMAPASYAPKGFEEGCSKCGGSGKFYGYSGRMIGSCFACKGAGKKVFKSSSADRAKARAGVAERKAKVSAEGFEAWQAANPALWQWLDVASKAGNQFAASLIGGVIKFGDLSQGQREAVERNIAKAAEKASHRAKAEAEAPEVAIERIEQAFAAAAASGKKRLKLKLSPKDSESAFVFSPAPMHGKNAGAIYVKSGSDYLGKVAGGKFIAAYGCDEVRKGLIIEVCADPEQAAVAYGKQFGSCSCCGRELSDPASVERGIGPICASKWGW
jgi:hypothetical protein